MFFALLNTYAPSAGTASTSEGGHHYLKIRELRSQLRSLDKDELTEILVQIYKVLPTVLIEEELIDDIIVDRGSYLEMRQQEKDEEKRLRQAYRENVTPIAALQKWKAIPENARKLLLNNVWCSHCGDERGLSEYSVDPAGPDIVLRGKCNVCHHDVARYVEIG